jgi:hypothetical protein
MTLRRIALTALLVCAALPARAGTFFVTVAGLGGEPDYDQRFTAAAMDLDHILKSSAGDVHVFTLTGANSARPHIEETLTQVSRQAKPDDDFVLILISPARTFPPRSWRPGAIAFLRSAS